MTNKNFTASFVVDKTPKEVFDAVNNVHQWWTENIKGHSKKLNDEFEVRFGDVHYSKQKLTEVVPNEKVVWLITDSQLNFIQQKDEWTNTKIIFEVLPQGNQTQLRFTQQGLVPTIECYDACAGAWGDYVNSLRSLITTGKGQPAPKE